MKKYTSWIIIIVLIAAVLGVAVWYSTPAKGQYDTLATCIKNSGTTFFGAFWCPHCAQEKALFGASWTKLPYVECSTPDGQGQTQVCIDNKIESYPTWQFKDGSRKEGVLSLQDLSTFTGCPLATDSQ